MVKANWWSKFSQYVCQLQMPRCQTMLRLLSQSHANRVLVPQTAVWWPGGMFAKYAKYAKSIGGHGWSWCSFQATMGVRSPGFSRFAAQKKRLKAELRTPTLSVDDALGTACDLGQSLTISCHT